MNVTEILRLSKGMDEIELSFNKETFITRLGEIELSKDELIQINIFIEKAIAAKNYKENKDSNMFSKLIKKIEGVDDSDEEK